MARRLVYYIACTLDGFIAHKDGSHEGFLFQGEHFGDLIKRFPECFPAHLREALGVCHPPQRFDTVLMGRNTYELGVRQGITSPYAPLRQYVASRSMRESPDATVELRRGDPLGLVRSLKAENGMDIWLCGGAKLAAAVVGEIDELILKINPVIFGTGISLFDGLEAVIPAIPIELQTYANGFVLARYAMRTS